MREYTCIRGAPEFFGSTRYAGPAGTYPGAQPPFLCHCSALETAEKPLPTHAQYDARVHRKRSCTRHVHVFTRSTRKVQNDPASTPENDRTSVSSRLNCRPRSPPPSSHPCFKLSNAFTETPFPFPLALFHLRISSSRIDSPSRSDPTEDSINPAAELRRNDYPRTEWPLERKHTRRENFNLLLLIGGN